MCPVVFFFLFYITLPSYIDRLPCPPPPMYGKELQLRLRRLEVFLREEDFDFLMAFRTLSFF